MPATDAFWAACDCPPSHELDARLEQIVAAAAAAYPDLRLPSDELLAYIASRWDGSDLADFLDRIEPGELALVLACVQGDAAALARFDRDYLREVRVGATRLRCDPQELDDITQEVRSMLLVATSERPAKIATMTARGDLRALIRLMAWRSGISLRRKQGRELPTADDAFEIAGDDETPSLMFAKEQHRALFSAALEAAMGRLDARARTTLKLHCLDGVPLAKLATMYKVDRSTITRWIVRSREKVMSETRRELAAETGISPERFASFLDVIRSNFGVSLRTMLE